MALQRIQPRGWWCPSASLLLFYLTGLFLSAWRRAAPTDRQAGSHTQALLAFVGYVSGKQHAGGGWQKEWVKGERDNLEVWGYTTCLTATSRLTQGGKWCKQATKPLKHSTKGLMGIQEKEKRHKVGGIHSCNTCMCTWRQMFAIMCRTFWGAKTACIFTDAYDSAHLSSPFPSSRGIQGTDWNQSRNANEPCRQFT